LRRLECHLPASLLAVGTSAPKTLKIPDQEIRGDPGVIHPGGIIPDADWVHSGAG